MDLTQQGFLANVQCTEVWCPMTKEFFTEYLKLDSLKGHKRTQQLLYILNPTKVRTCENLMRYHKHRGDKIILFSDDVPALLLYSELLEIPYIYGQTSQQERSIILSSFRSRSNFNVIGLSKVGDTALDIPEANVIIQV
jgi:DNA excision repair protein ERCC-3